MRIGFALVTDDEFLRQIVEISNEVGRRHAFLDELGLQHNLPHTTLYQGYFADDYNYRAALDNIAALCRQDGVTTMEFTDVQYVNLGWYFYVCNETDAIMQLHNDALDLIEQDIVLDPIRLQRDISVLPQDQQEGILRYGYRYARTAFMPHITLGRTREEEDPAIMQELTDRLHAISRNSRIQRLTVYEMGPNGTHKSTLAEIRLY